MPIPTSRTHEAGQISIDIEKCTGCDLCVEVCSDANFELIAGKENGDLFRDFIKPVMESYTGLMKEGKNVVMYDAPLAFYFYGSPYTDPADPIVACTYAMHAAKALGLGTCMLGAIHPFIQSGGAAKKFRQKHGIRFKSKEGLFLIVGYPKVKYRKGIRRTFANVNGLS